MDTKSITQAQKDVGMELMERGYGHLRDYNKGRVTIVWENMPKDYFRLIKDNKDIVLNKHELQYLLRNV